jgi:hypothetical protein
VDGRTYTQTVTVRSDPRSPATAAGLRAQHALQMQMYETIKTAYAGREAAIALRNALRGAIPSGAAPELADVAARAAALSAQLDTVAGPDGQRRFVSGPPPAPSFTAIHGALISQLNAQDLGDLAPTSGAVAAFAATCKELATVVASWDRLSRTELTGFNTALKSRGRAVLVVPGGVLKAPSCR